MVQISTNGEDAEMHYHYKPLNFYTTDFFKFDHTFNS